MGNTQHYSSVIVGGGIAGVYLSTKIEDALLLEAQPWLGGRIRTMYDETKKKVLLEQGPWRVHESHARMRTLIKKYNLHLTPTSSSLAGGGSAFDAIVLNEGIARAREVEQDTGYVGMLDGLANTDVYHAQRHKKGTYYTVDEGLHALIDAMAEESKATIQCNSKVKDIQYQHNIYYITYCQRQGESIKCVTCTCDRLFLCVPPHVTKQWTIVKQYLKPQVHSVQTHPLHHIYAKGDLGRNVHLRTRGVLSQVVSGDYDKRYFQVSYSAGRVAQFWNRLQLENPSRFRALLQEQLKQEGFEVPLEDVKSFYWHHAVHSWVPLYGLPSVDSLVKKSIEPHPILLPKLYWAGEAFSSVQGWCEGALQTAEMVLEACQGKSFVLFDAFPDEFVVLDQRVLDVSMWKEVHPGSTAAITKRLKYDISTLFRHINHSELSWATVFALQVGYVR